MTNPVVEWQIVAQDPTALATFYSKTFGWTVTTENALGYRQVDTGPGGTPGGIWPAPPGVPAFVQLFVRVPDVAAAAEQAQALGAKLLVPPATLPDGDTMAILQDPAGLSFGIVQAR